MKIHRGLVAVIIGAASSASLASVSLTVLGNYPGECVAYVRSILPGLPTGLFSYADKLRIVNKNTCTVGSAAIIRIASGPYAQYGHIAYVENCTSGITIREANWRSGKITRRQVNGTTQSATSELNIVGYWVPKR